MPAEGWVIDGVDLESHCRIIETRDGWDDIPGARGDNATLLGRHGQVWRRKRFDAGRKTLTVGVHGCLDMEFFTLPATGTEQRALYEKHLDELLRLVAVRTRLLSVERRYPDGSTRRADCEVTAPITPATLADSYGQMQIDLIVPGAFWEDRDTETYTLTYDPAGDDEQRVEAYSLRGQTAPCTDAVVTVTGGCSSVSVLDYLTGAGFAYGAVSEGESLVVDAGAFTAEKNGVDVITSMSMAGGGLLEVSSAPSATRGPDLRVTATGASGGFSVTLVTRRKWLR